MFDSTSPAAIPADALVVAGYVDGLYAWTPEDWSRFPTARRVAISVDGDPTRGDVLDVETGAASPAQCRVWIEQRPPGLVVPTIYCSLSAVPAVQASCAGLTYDLWTADPTGVAHITPGAAATQYAWGRAGTYDTSLCQPYWPRAGSGRFT